MPVHHHADEWHLVQRGLGNYWGYNTLAYFAPDLAFAGSAHPLDAVREFKMMVRALHGEVVDPVVLTHRIEVPAIPYRGQTRDRRTWERLTAV
jgi:glycogen operon protein